MNSKKPLLWILIATGAIIVGGIFFISTTTQNAPHVKASNTAKAYTVEPTSFDWGTIVYSGPKATKTFTIKNTGTGTLTLYNVRTSCHCTKAYLTIDGQGSPAFGMDMGGNASSYVGNVKPGDTAKLTVIFDPAFHGPTGVGPITRYVNIDTNDKGQQSLTFTLTGTVVNK